MKKIFLLFLIVNYSMLFAQSQFQLAVGGGGDDYARSIIQTTDGGYAAAGYTSSFGAGNLDMYIVKLDASGTLQWSKTIGVIGGTTTDVANSIIQTTDGGYAVAGYTYTSPYYRIYIVKLDAGGTLQWSKTIGVAGYYYAFSIIRTTDGGYAAAGWTSSFGAGGEDMYIVKLDASGTLQWSKTIGGTGSDISWSIIQTTDGGYAAAGWTSSFGAGGEDMYIVKLDASGTLQWSKTIGGTGSDYAYSVVQTNDGGYAAAGYTSSFGAGSYDFYIMKLDAGGTLQWSKTIGGTNNDYAYSIIQTTDGGYAATGYTRSFGVMWSDVYIVKFDATGTLQWGRTVVGTAFDFAYSIIPTTDGGFAVAGSNGDMYIVKFDAGGNTCGNSNSPTSTVTTPTTTITTPTSTVTTPTPTVTTPTSVVNSGGTVTTLCLVGIEPISNEEPQSFKLYQNYPNPFNNSSKFRVQSSKSGLVKIEVFDVLGRFVTTLVNEELKPGTYEVEWDALNYPSGVYFYRLQAGDFSDSKKMLLIK